MSSHIGTCNVSCSGEGGSGSLNYDHRECYLPDAFEIKVFWHAIRCDGDEAAEADTGQEETVSSGYNVN